MKASCRVGTSVLWLSLCAAAASPAAAVTLLSCGAGVGAPSTGRQIDRNGFADGGVIDCAAASNALGSAPVGRVTGLDPKRFAIVPTTLRLVEPEITAYTRGGVDLMQSFEPAPSVPEPAAGLMLVLGTAWLVAFSKVGRQRAPARESAEIDRSAAP